MVAHLPWNLRMPPFCLCRCPLLTPVHTCFPFLLFPPSVDTSNLAWDSNLKVAFPGTHWKETTYFRLGHLMMFCLVLSYSRTKALLDNFAKFVRLVSASPHGRMQLKLFRNVVCPRNIRHIFSIDCMELHPDGIYAPQ